MDIAKKIIDQKTRHVVLVIANGCLDGDEHLPPKQLFSYVQVKPSRVEEIKNMKLDGSKLVNIREFCDEVIHSEYGLPSEEVKKYMEEHYKVIYPF